MGLKAPPHSFKNMNHIGLKSDQDGIERYMLFGCALANSMLKSDQDGIESNQSKEVMMLRKMIC